MPPLDPHTAHHAACTAELCCVEEPQAEAPQHTFCAVRMAASGALGAVGKAHVQEMLGLAPPSRKAERKADVKVVSALLTDPQPTRCS